MVLMPPALRASRLRLYDRVLQEHFARHRQMALVSGPRQSNAVRIFLGQVVKQGGLQSRDLKEA